MLRRWATPVAVGIMSPSGTVTVSSEAVPRQAANGDAPHGDDAPVAPLPAWARSATSWRVAQRDESRSPSWFALPNGVRLAVQRRTGSNHVYVRAGFDDAHLFGRVGDGVGRVAGSIFVAGSRRWPELRIAKASDAHAMSIDLDAESNANGFATDLPLMLDIIADTWRAPRMNARNVRGARRAAIREADRFAHNPDGLAVTILAHRLDDPDAHDPAPAADQRHADTSERAVRAFFRTHVRPDRAWLAVVGDVDPATVYRQVTRALGGWRVTPSDSSPSAGPAAAALPVRPAVRRIRVPRQVTRVLLGTTAPKRRDPDHAGMTLLDTVLAGAMETRSMRAIRFRRGLAYSVSSSYDDDAGRFFVGFQCAPADRAAASALLRSTLDDLAVHPPTPDELDRARGKLIGDALRVQRSADGMLDALTTAARDRRGDESLAELDARYRAVRSSDLARIARTYLDSTRFVEVDVGP
jgi:predicted Zn-dependent peptidase